MVAWTAPGSNGVSSGADRYSANRVADWRTGPSPHPLPRRRSRRSPRTYWRPQQRTRIAAGRWTKQPSSLLSRKKETIRRPDRPPQRRGKRGTPRSDNSWQRNASVARSTTWNRFDPIHFDEECAMDSESSIVTSAGPTKDSCDTSVPMPARKSSIAVLSPRLASERSPSANSRDIDLSEIQFAERLRRHYSATGNALQEAEVRLETLDGPFKRAGGLREHQGIGAPLALQVMSDVALMPANVTDQMLAHIFAGRNASYLVRWVGQKGIELGAVWALASHVRWASPIGRRRRSPGGSRFELSSDGDQPRRQLRRNRAELLLRPRDQRFQSREPGSRPG